MTNDLSAGTRVKARDFPRAYQSFNQESQVNITDTSYTPAETGDPECAVRFLAPSSGRVAVVLSAGVRNNTAANEDRVFVSFRVLEGDPADNELFQTEEVKLGISNSAAGADDFQYAGHATMVQGLTPGVHYYAQIRHRTTLGAGTADISFRKILVFPLS